ncbi:MAG: sigma-70 family RNA polymerase sigma factor [Planctomycetota bacterium]
METKTTAERKLTESSRGNLKTVALRTYSSHQEKPVNDEQITEFLPLVRRIAQRVATYLKPPLSLEDLVSAGTVGLMKASRDFDPSHQAEFKTYAYTRIKGAVLDELRDCSLLPSHLNKQIKDAVRTSRKIMQETGTTPNDAELANKLGISLEKLYKTFENARAQHFISIDNFGGEQNSLVDLLAAPNATTPDQQLERTELTDKLSEAIQLLDDRRQQIILLYYQQDLTMKQIAKVFEITESRVSQLHASALFYLSLKLRQWKDGG